MSTNENDSKEPGALTSFVKSPEAKKYYIDLACGITKAVAITAAAVITANLISNAFASDDEPESESESESSDDIIDE